MKIKRRLVTLLLCCCVLFLSACGVNFSNDGSAGSVPYPEYTDNGEGFRIAAYRPPFGVLRTDEQYRAMAEANINYVYGCYDTTLTDMLEAMDLCSKYGMKYLVYDQTTEAAIRANTVTESVVEAFLETIGEVSSHSAFAGVYLIDEPSYAILDGIKMVTDAFREAYPGKEIMVNMHPSWQAQPEHIGPNGYQAYVDKVYEVAPGVLSYDNYPLAAGSPNYIDPSYVQNLDIVARKARDNGVKYYNYIQLTEAYGVTASRACSTYEEIAWQCYTSMAYGVSGVQTFTWVAPSSAQSGPVTSEGELTETYESFCKVTDEIDKWDYVYGSFDWQYTMLFQKPNTRLPDFSIEGNTTEHERIESVEYDEHLMIGAFKDDEGRDGFMIANYSDPEYGLSNEVTIKFKDCNYIMTYHKGIRSIEKLKRGSYTFNLTPGDGVFAIVF